MGSLCRRSLRPRRRELTTLGVGRRLCRCTLLMGREDGRLDARLLMVPHLTLTRTRLTDEADLRRTTRIRALNRRHHPHLLPHSNGPRAPLGRVLYRSTRISIMTNTSSSPLRPFYSTPCRTEPHHPIRARASSIGRIILSRSTPLRIRTSLSRSPLAWVLFLRRLRRLLLASVRVGDRGRARGPIRRRSRRR